MVANEAKEVVDKGQIVQGFRDQGNEQILYQA